MDEGYTGFRPPWRFLVSLSSPTLVLQGCGSCGRLCKVMSRNEPKNRKLIRALRRDRREALYVRHVLTTYFHGVFMV